MKKIGLIILTLILVIGVVHTIRSTFTNVTKEEPNIYHLRDVYNCTYYVFPRFQDNPYYIKYLFDFVNKHSGTLVIIGNKNDVSFEDGIDYIDESDRKSPYFFFSRADSSALYYERIRISFTSENINFHVMVDFDDSNNMEQKKIKADFENINLNITQDFLDYIELDTIKKGQKNYSYELCNKNDEKKVQVVYHEFGKWFTINVY